MSKIDPNKIYQINYPETLFRQIKHIGCMAHWQHAIVKYTEDGYTSGTVWVTERQPGFLTRQYGRVLVDRTNLDEINTCICAMRTLNLRGCQCGGD